MTFTNVDLVKKHISENNLGTEKIENLLFQLVGKDYLQLPHTHIKTDSEKVKGKESLSPAEEQISFASGDPDQRRRPVQGRHGGPRRGLEQGQE